MPKVKVEVAFARVLTTRVAATLLAEARQAFLALVAVTLLDAAFMVETIVSVFY